MEKYLGNKRAVLDAIHAFVQESCPGSKSLFDIFSGTTNVARYFWARGYDVAANDVNRFSYVLGSTYLCAGGYPDVAGLKSVGRNPENVEYLRRYFLAAAAKDRGQLFPVQRGEDAWKQAVPVARLLAWLNAAPETKNGPSHVFDHYCAEGARSAYESIRGTKGRRNYFSAVNARRLDAVLNRIRTWYRAGSISDAATHLLLTSVLEEVTLTANVNGTFHDFNRTRLWPNALQEFWLKVPLVYSGSATSRIYCEDALDAARKCPAHDVLYIDPPYNFRQYSAYYHLLNFVAAYPYLPSVSEYLSQIEHVRGQNMRDDFTSAFCFRDRFVAALREVIAESRSRYVVLSYYGGRNHWNHWARTTELTDEGISVLAGVFEDAELFSESRRVPVLQLRRNYQSRVGEKKAWVNEHLLWGKRRDSASSAHGESQRGASPNLAMGLKQFRPKAYKVTQVAQANVAKPGLGRTRRRASAG